MSTTDTRAVELNAEDYRGDFPILSQRAASGARIVFLDNAASTQRPLSVIQTMAECYTQYYANVHRGIHTFSELSTERFEGARSTVAKFLNANSDREVVFTAGTTAAINTVARTWGEQHIGAGDKILLTMAEHHANIVPWHQLASRTGAEVHFVPLTEDGRVELPTVERMLDELRPKLFAFTAVSNVLGTVIPVKELVSAAHQRGAMTLVDSAQAAPHQRIDVQDWDADFVVFSGHKLCGPTGIGVLWGREGLLEAMPPFMGGGGMIHSVTTKGFTPAALPEKFEAGTPPIVEAIGLAAAIDYVTEVGLDRIERHERRLTQRAHQGLADIPGLKILGPDVEQKAGIVSFVIDKVHAHDVAQALDRRGVAVRAGHHCAMPLHESLEISASARASFYFYNTLHEVDLFVDAVVEARDRFAPKGRKRTPAR